MPLREAFTGARIIETNDNYSRADKPLFAQPEQLPGGGQGDYFDDEQFWQRVSADPEGALGTVFFFGGVALSEWVARVPGLFWEPRAQSLRKLAESRVEYVSNGWRVYPPPGKSDKVMGGIGTLRLSPSVDGTRLVTLTTTCNASAGVPALVCSDVWDFIGRSGPHEGQILQGEARWQSMGEGWAARFRSTRDVPRGYLVLTDPRKIQVLEGGAPIAMHPFTVMEYYRGARELFDYVYATGDTGYPNYRGHLAEFFDSYKDQSDRHGRYLLACDMVNPLWDAEYDSPAELRRADLSAESQLELLENRVNERLLGEDKIDAMLEALATTSDSEEDPKRLSADIGIPPAVWFRGGSLTEICSQFVREVVRRGKLAECVETFAIFYPSAIA